jgi:hypothetical protein
VLERYPHNGKLLKIWGRFQEWVLHDPADTILLLLLLLLLLRAQGAGALAAERQAAEDLGALPGVGAHHHIAAAAAAAAVVSRIGCWSVTHKMASC